MPPANDLLELLLANLDDAYGRRGWHGPTLRGSIRGLAAEEALRRPGPGRHNVFELTLHAAYWKYVARRRLTGERERSFPLKGSNWFPVSSATEKEWRAAVRLLDEQHRLLRAAVAALGPQDLRNRTRLRLVYGVAAHDVYHTGQIQLVKRLVSG